MRVIVPNFIKIGHTVADIWRFNGFYNGGRPPSWLCEIRNKFLTVGAVKRPILHQHTKFRKDRSNRYGEIAIFVIFQDGGRRHFVLVYQILSKSVKRLQRYSDLTVF